MYIAAVTILVVSVFTWLSKTFGLVNISMRVDSPMIIDMPKIDEIMERNNQAITDSKVNSSETSLSVLWYARIDQGTGGDGFARESIDFMTPLAKLMSFGWYGECSVSDLKISSVYKDLNPRDKGLMMRLFINGSKINNNFMLKDQNVISLIFDQPTRYDDLFVRTRLKYSTYNIGRAMFETSWIPNKWEYYINEHLDELWVPSKFAYNIFKKAGVYIPIKIIQEGFDSNVYNGDLKVTRDSEDRSSHERVTAARTITEMRNTFFPHCKELDTIFITVGKMENRKGIEALIEVFFQKFSKDDPVCLYIRSDLPSRNKRRVAKIQNTGLRIKEMGRLTSIDLAKVYTSADVFVLPTHGEGWGRPIMEAMASGLPVIVPFWSGLTDFVSPEYALTIPVTEWVPAFAKEDGAIGGKRYGEIHQWAKINTTKLKEILEWTVQNPKKAKEIGLKGRTVMFERFERNMVAKTVADRLIEIKTEILAKGVASYKDIKALKNKERVLENTYGDHGAPGRIQDIRNQLNTLERLADSSDKSLEKIVEELKKEQTVKSTLGYLKTGEEQDNEQHEEGPPALSDNDMGIDPEDIDQEEEQNRHNEGDEED